MKKIALFIVVVMITTFFFHGLLAVLTRNETIQIDSLTGQALLILGGSAPAIFAFVFLIREPKKQRMLFYASLFDTIQPKKYWFFTLGLPIILISFIAYLYAYVEGTLPLTVEHIYFYPLYLLAAILFGGLEEVGWRGYLQRHLQGKLKLPLIALLIGVVWGFWHSAMFFVEGLAHQEYHFIAYLFGAILFSAYLTVLYYKTRSVLLTILFHASINAVATLGIRIPFINHWVIYLGIVLLTIPAYIWLFYLDYETQVNDVTTHKKKDAYDAVIIDKKEKK